jgi:L-alanine-DL-glutamate epimerase-like enolase superfamily enzyme
MKRRHFFSLAAAAAAARVPALAQQERSSNLRIAAVELVRLEGKREQVTGVNRQYQVQPLHVYEALRPQPYKDDPAPKTTTAAVRSTYLRIRTDGGIDGLYGPIDREAVFVVQEQLSPFLKGKDPLAGEALWDQLYRTNRHSRAGHFMIGLSAVDNALWDLRGRYYNTPVYRLLGGPTRSAATAYGSALGFTTSSAQAAGKRAAQLKAAGFRHQKWFLPYGPGHGAEGMAANVDLVRALRDSVGPDVDLMFDAFMGWDLQYAQAWAKQVEQYRPRWIEEAFHVEKLGSFIELRRSTSIPVATGEHFYGRWEVQRFLDAGAISVVQADPEWCGGVSELVKICHIASGYDAQVIPHGHGIHAALHVVASQSPMTCPLVEYLINKMESYHHFEKHPPKAVDGKLTLPERPGFGIEFDPSKVERETLLS